jgi:uncharacterized protein VirK/YbjX
LTVIPFLVAASPLAVNQKSPTKIPLSKRSMLRKTFLVCDFTI